jgi:hypothetical protein
MSRPIKPRAAPDLPTQVIGVCPSITLVYKMSGPTSHGSAGGLIPDFWGGLRFTVAPARPQIGICRKLRPRPAKNTREKISHISYDKKNQASKHHRNKLPTCRRSRARMGRSHASTNISAMARSACLPASISLPVRSAAALFALHRPSAARH